MSGKIVFKFVQVSVTIAYYLMLFFAAFFLVISIVQSFQDDSNNKWYGSEAMAFSKTEDVPSYKYSGDGLVRYQPSSNRYKVEIKARSVAGFYTIVMKIIFVGLGIAILWTLKHIFEQTKLEDPFRADVIRRLKILAILFAVSDLLKIIDYLLFNSLMKRSIASLHFQLLIEIGDGIITGLIVWIIAIIFQRGIALQEENALTV